MAKIIVEKIDPMTNSAEINQEILGSDGTKFHSRILVGDGVLWTEFWLEDPPLQRKNRPSHRVN